MSNYTALYRAWRPKQFNEVVGQTDIIEALKNQIKNGSIAHAYLFSGTRGTGKTSTAKIFSRAINCLNPVESNPCNQCEICKGILEETLMDVVEIDAASNNGVDDIRELRENVKYPPSRSRYKVYIIDEVHMLSTGAFNALLKTLEEPPSYVIFILATTEPHKLPATILSRCQRYDFKRVGNVDITSKLSMICNSKGVAYDDEALSLITRKADGAFRDSESMLDQCISGIEGKLTIEAVMACLGVVTHELITDMVNAAYAEETTKLFELVEQLVNNGKNLNQFVKDLIDYVRDLMMVASAGPIEKILRTSAPVSVLDEQARRLGLERILRDLALLIDLDHQMKWSTNTRIQMEMTLVKMTKPVSAPVVSRPAPPVTASVGTAVNTSQSNSSPVNTPTLAAAVATPTQSSEPARPAPLPTTGDADPAVIANKWPEVIQYLAKQKKASLRALLVEGTLVGTVGKIVQVGYEELYGFHLNAIQRDENRQEVERAIYAVTGFSVRVQFDFVDAFKGTSAAVSETDDVDALKQALGNYADKLEIIKD